MSVPAYVCPPGFECTGPSCPALGVPCPKGAFCGDALATGVSRTWLDTEFQRWRDDPRGTTYTDYWAERPCFRGVSCANASTLAECAPGTWCPRGNAGPLRCDPLSVCGPRAYYQINFIAPLIAAGLTAVVVVVSWTLVRRQRAAAVACRALAARGVVRELTPSSSLAAISEAAAGGDGNAAKPRHLSVSSSSPNGLDFVFDDLVLTTGSGGVALLHGVSGRAAPGRVTALLGPSGCGKSLLMATLRDGRAPAGGDLRLARTSRLTVNGTPAYAVPGGLRARIGYVPKDDVVDRELTPRELLTLSAALRLPAGTTAAQVDAAVDGTLAALGLTGIADVVIGGSSSTAANISGGQLKRVSIGYELVARPQALFLDEPTSGLDATAALDLMASLREISRSRGVTVVAVLHQPRAEVWRLLDHVLLMARARDQVAPALLQQQGHAAAAAAAAAAAPLEEGGADADTVQRTAPAADALVGGCVIYEGPPSGAVPYFTRPALGYALPPGRSVNPADFCLDVAGGLLLPVELERQVTRVRRSVSTASAAAGGSGAPTRESSPRPAAAGAPPAGGGAGAMPPLVLSMGAGAPASAATSPRSPPSPPSSLVAQDLASTWRRYLQASRSGSGGSEDSSKVSLSDAGAGTPLPPPLTDGVHPPPARPGFWVQANAQARRAFIVRMRGTGFLALYGFLHVFLSVALSAGFTPLIQGDYLYEPPIPAVLLPYVPPFLRERARFDVSSEAMQQLMFFVTVSCGVGAGMAASGLFSTSHAWARRDVGAGLSPLAFAAGRMASDLLIIGWDASLFAGVWMLLGPAGLWSSWLAIFVGVGVAASGIGYVAGALLSPASASMACMVACLLCAVFSGIEPPLLEVRPLPVVNWAWYLSFGTWVAQAVLITFTAYWEGVRSRPGSASKFGFDIGGFDTAIGAMFGIGLLLRAVALLVVHATTTGEPLPGWRAAGDRCCRRRKSAAPAPPADSEAPATVAV